MVPWCLSCLLRRQAGSRGIAIVGVSVPLLWYITLACFPLSFPSLSLLDPSASSCCLQQVCDDKHRRDVERIKERKQKLYIFCRGVCYRLLSCRRACLSARLCESVSATVPPDLSFLFVSTVLFMHPLRTRLWGSTSLWWEDSVLGLALPTHLQCFARAPSVCQVLRVCVN